MLLAERRPASKIVGYADRFSVEPDDTIRFMESCELPSYGVDVVRLNHGDPNPRGPGFKEAPVETSAAGSYPGRVQRIHSGSRITDNVLTRFAADEPLPS